MNVEDNIHIKDIPEKIYSDVKEEEEYKIKTRNLIILCNLYVHVSDCFASWKSL